MGQNFDSARAAARIVLDRGYEALAGRQIWVFDNVVRPLIQNVQCHGYQGAFGKDNHVCPRILNDEELDDCYVNENFLCEQCQGEADGDEHSRQGWMED